MSVTPLRADGAQSAYAAKNNQQTVEIARQAAYQLLGQFEIFLEGMIQHQVEQGHFKKRYEVPSYALKEHRAVNGIRYEGVHALYSSDPKRAKTFESLHDALRVLGDLYDSIPDDYLGAWQDTIEKIDTLVLDKNVSQLVEEYLNTLPTKTRKSLQEEAKNKMENCRQALLNLSENRGPKTLDTFSRSFRQFISYEGMKRMYESTEKLYTDTEQRERITKVLYSVTRVLTDAGFYAGAEEREKIAKALSGMKRVLADTYETIPAHCMEAWQATLKQLDTLALDENINAFAKEYLNILPPQAHDTLKQKIQINLEACRQALNDIKEAQQTKPSPVFELFTKLLTIGTRFFERLQVLFQSLIEKQNGIYFDKPDAANAA